MSDKGNEAIKSLDRDIIFTVDELNALSKEEQIKKEILKEWRAKKLERGD